VITERGPVRIELPRDRDGSFEPILIPKHERRFTGFDDKIIAMYARGMSVREIQGFIAESYGTQVSPDFISSITDEVRPRRSPGRVGRSSRCIRWCSSIPCG
jgi:transposase-like protein